MNSVPLIMPHRRQGGNSPSPCRPAPALNDPQDPQNRPPLESVCLLRVGREPIRRAPRADSVLYLVDSQVSARSLRMSIVALIVIAAAATIAVLGLLWILFRP